MFASAHGFPKLVKVVAAWSTNFGKWARGRKIGHGQEETWRSACWRTRLVRDLRRPHGSDDELLRDARRLLHHGQQQAQDRRRFDARGLRRADRGTLFRHHRIRWTAEAAQAEKRRPYLAGRSLQHADAGPAGPETGRRRAAEDRSRIRAGLGFAASGIAGHAGDD